MVRGIRANFNSFFFEVTYGVGDLEGLAGANVGGLGNGVLETVDGLVVKVLSNLTHVSHQAP